MNLLFIRHIRRNFTAKILLSVSLLIVIASIAITIAYIRVQGNTLRDKLLHEGELLSQMLAYTSRLAVFSENTLLLTDPLEGIMQNKQVMRVDIWVADGKLLLTQRRAPNSSPESGRGSIDDAPLPIPANLPHRDETSDYVAFWAPVITLPYANRDHLLLGSEQQDKRNYAIGTVRVVLSKADLNKQLRSLLFTSIIITLIALVLGWLILAAIIRGITRPLNALTGRVKALDSGDRNVTMPVQTTDEIGELASAFNGLVANLRRREAEKLELEEQLRHSQKMESIGTLAGGVAHDFNNFLTAIIGYGNLLQLSVKKSDSNRIYVDQILTAAERAANLTQRLLAFGRKQVMNLRPIYLNDVVKGIEKLLSQLIGEDIDFSCRPGLEKIIVMADPGQIDQVLINLATNARDAMPQGGKLTITTAVVDLELDSPWIKEGFHPGRYACLTVTDSGIGFDDATRLRIFDPFFTTKEVGKGTGLGLSVVYGIVRQHSGFINVTSSEGNGSTFSLYLPLIETTVEPVRGDQITLPKGNYETILLAEDEEIVRSFARELLQAYHYRVIEASNGEEALQRFQDNQDEIDILLLDVIMPKMNGKDLYDRVRAVRPNIKAVFISGYTNEILNRKVILDEGIHFVAKPLHPSELLNKLRQVLEQ